MQLGAIPVFDAMQLNAGTIGNEATIYSGTSAPEGLQTGSIGDVFIHKGGSIYRKNTGTGTTGWLSIYDASTLPSSIIDTAKNGVSTPAGLDLNTVDYTGWGLYNSSTTSNTPSTSITFWWIVTQKQFTNSTGDKIQWAFPFRLSGFGTWSRNYDTVTTSWTPWRKITTDSYTETTSINSSILTNAYMNTNYPTMGRVVFSNLSDAPSNVIIVERFGLSVWHMFISSVKLT